MTQPNLENYDELCRLCATYDAIKMDIFSDRGRERNLLDKITTCLPFKVSEDDLLPKSLCYRCIYNLENFYDFRRGCIAAWKRLKRVVELGLHSESKVLPQEEERENQNASERVETGPRKPLPSPAVEEPENEKEAVDSDSEPPNPADFLEACLVSGEVPVNPSGKKNSLNTEEDEGPFRCEVCSRLFNNRSSLTIHSKFHRETVNGGEEREMFSCYVCEKVFSSKGHLALHSRVHIGEAHSPAPLAPPSSRAPPSNVKLYRCDLCSKTYSMAKHLWGHVSTSHRGDPLVTCSVCLRTFSSISNLEDHKRVKHKNINEQQMESGTLQQPEFGMSTETATDYSLVKPSSEVVEEKKVVPEESSGNKRKSSKPRKIEREKDRPPEAEAFVEVAKEDMLQVRLSQDAEQQQSPNGFTCMFCGTCYKDQALLSAHLLTYHGGTGPPEMTDYNHDGYMESEFAESLMEAETVFCCEICIREFSDKASLWLHMLYSHRDEAAKACGICLKICPDNETLIRHVETSHPRDKTEQRRYSCQVCARQHDSRKKLITHAKIHKLTDGMGNLIDPETVVVLNSEFYSNDSSAQHSTPNDGSYLQQCEICYNFYDSEAKLVKHKRSAHRDTVGPNSSSGSNTYHYYFACEICGLSHTTRTDRWRHMNTTHVGDPLVTCELPDCKKVFPTSAVKREHEEHHKTQGKYPNTCEICGKMWKTRVEYWKHMMGVHSDCLPYICGVCLKVFVNLADLVTHVRTLHWPLTGGDFCCDICGRPYSKASKMSRHRKIHNVPDIPNELRALLDNPKIQTEPHFLQQGTQFLCDLCDNGDKEYDCLDELNKHRRSIHNVMPCDLCMKYYGRTSHLWKHVNKIHKGHLEITCKLCQRTSASRLHLSNHMLKHHRNDTAFPGTTSDSTTKENGSAHSCDKCSKIFRKESLVKKHMRHCKGPRQSLLPKPENGIYSCEKCNKKFTVQNTLYKHMKNAHINYNCELCDSIVESKTELFNHVCESHADHPDVKCDYKDCDKILRCKADLDRHTRDHRQNLQLHVCKFCAELVSSKMKLRKHLKTAHAKDSKHLCALCLKASLSFKDLRVHIEECHAVALSRPNTCPVCAKACGQKSKLLDHIKCHGSTFHPCKICLKIFSSKEELNDHVSNHPSDSGDEEDQMEEVELDPNSIMDIIGAPKNEMLEIRRSDDESETKRKSSEDACEVPVKKPKHQFRCDVCEETFPTSIELLDHKECCRKETKCEKCGLLLNTSLGSKKCSCGVKEMNSSEVCKKELKCESCGSASSNTSPGNKRCSLCGCKELSTREVNSNSILQSALLVSKKEGEETNHLEKSQELLTPNSEKLGRGKNNRKVYNDDFTPSKCEICGKVWPAKRHLWQHLIRFHKNEAGTSCGVCLKLCPDYKSLSAHLSIEHPFNFEGDGTNLSCRVCGKYHNARSKLQNHITIHSGQEERALSNLHHCLHCTMKFASFPVLCDHIKKVHNIRDIPKQSSEEGNWKVDDVEEAIVPKPGSKLPFYSCDVCSLVFASEIGLTNHRRMHDHSDNFKCGQCGEVLPTAEALGAHKASKHKGAEFVCADCKSNFASYQLLIEHNKRCIVKIKNCREGGSRGDEGEGAEVGVNGESVGGEAEDSSSSSSSESEDNEDKNEDSESSDESEATSDHENEDLNSADEFEELVEVVEVDIDACPSSPKSDS